MRPRRFGKGDPGWKTTAFLHAFRDSDSKLEQERKGFLMRLKEPIKQAGATGYILLWLLGVPIPVLLLFFLLRGFT
jgi:hypothetical protein